MQESRIQLSSDNIRKIFGRLHTKSLAKKCGATQRKERKFSTNNVDLPNTGIYNDRPTSMYWLDFGKKKNVSFLLNLILDTYVGKERILANDLFFEVLRHLSNQMLIELDELPRDFNSYLIEELQS